MPITKIATPDRAFVRLHEVYKQGDANMARETLPSRWTLCLFARAGM